MKTSNLTLGSILTSFIVIVLYLTSLIPTNTLTLLTIASLFVPIALMRSNVKTAWTVYIASTLVAIFIVPVNIVMIYGLFFGCYGIIKYFIESINRLILEYVLKLIFFNIVFFVGLYFLENIVGISLLNNFKIMFSSNTKNGHFFLLWCSGQIVFLIYDYALTLLIDMYRKYF